VAHSFNPDFDDEPLTSSVEGFVIGIYRIDGRREELFYDPEGLTFPDP
jgi:hypothetical protein